MRPRGLDWASHAHCDFCLILAFSGAIGLKNGRVRGIVHSQFRTDLNNGRPSRLYRSDGLAFIVFIQRHFFDMTFVRTTLLLLVLSFIGSLSTAHAQEKVFGEKVVGPGVKLSFIAAPKDAVRPKAKHLAENRTDIHLEVLAGWTEEASTTVGAPAGGFVPYLHLFARVTNERTGQTQNVSLVPHINLSDNAHYARNVALPGAPDDPYSITFSVNPPEQFELATHRDWRQKYGDTLFEPVSVTYEGVQLLEVAEATR